MRHETSGMGAFDRCMGRHIVYGSILFYKCICKKGDEMMRKAMIVFLVAVVPLAASGCAALFIGVAAGGVGMYAASNDAIQGETGRSYETVWEAALNVSKIRGTISKLDSASGLIELDADSSKVWIRVTRLTRATTRLRVAARKFKLPNLTLAQDMFLKIIDQTSDRNSD
jgi:hypothetical protein